MPWPIFPQCPTYGFTSRPDYSVTIVERGSGVRSVNRNWYYPLHTYTAVPIGDKFEDDIHRVIRFWHAVGGQSGQFLFNDYVDYRSSRNISEDTEPTDQPLVLNADSPGGYQMVKLYQDEEFLFQQQRLIQKPKDGTIRVAKNGLELAEGADFVVDYDTGLVTFLVSVSGGDSLTWGGEFFVPVMFETTPEFLISNKQIQQTTFSLRELRLED